MEIIKKLEKTRILDFFTEFLLNSFFSILRSWFRKNSSGNIIIISLHKIGDTVFTIPAVKQVFKHFPNQSIYVLTFPESKDLYNILFDDDSIIIIERNSIILGGRIASRKARKILKNLHPELIFDLTGNIASASLIASSYATKIVGMNLKYCRSIYDVYEPIRHQPHLIDLYLDVVKAYLPLNENNIIKEFPIKFKTEEKILIHPFAGWKAKEWNLNKFIELTSLLNDDYKVEIVSAENLIPKDIIHEIRDRHIPISITTSIKDLIKKINDSSVFISNDSGPLYIAAILGKPTFTIYGPTNPLFSLPFGQNHSFIRKKIICSPEKDKQYCSTNAGRKGCPSFECMNLLQVKDVYENLNSFFNELGIKNKISNNETL